MCILCLPLPRKSQQDKQCILTLQEGLYLDADPLSMQMIRTLLHKVRILLHQQRLRMYVLDTQDRHPNLSCTDRGHNCSLILAMILLVCGHPTRGARTDSKCRDLSTSLPHKGCMRR